MITLIICIPIALLLWLIIGDVINEKKYVRRYQEYIDSIRVGDIFEPNFVEDFEDLNLDPFDEVIDYTEYSKTILDIKKNKKGETWVKYKRLNDDFEYTQEIHMFVEYHKRVKQSEI
jgi:hypothetical protein